VSTTTTLVNSPATATTATTSSLTLDGSLVVSILGQTYTLEGTLGDGVNVEYHKDFDQAINLGPVTAIAEQIASALGFSAMQSDITDALSAIQGLPVIGKEIANLMNTASARITDLVINTNASTYEVGLALDFSLSPPTLLGIELIALGFKVISSPNTSTTTGTSTTGTGTTGTGTTGTGTTGTGTTTS